MRLPIEEAHTWPTDVYTSHEWYEREIEQIFLKTWLVDHINGTDQKYVPYLHDKGVSGKAVSV